jgi:tripartite ATP-independent transporter DctP family solute receptor
MNTFLKVATVALAAAAFNTGALAQEITLHLGHNTQVEHPINIASDKFAELVAQKSNGTMKVVVYPAEQLATLRAGAEGVQLGTVDLYWSDSGTLGNWAPQYSFVSLPFMFPDFDSAVATMDKLEPTLVENMRTDLNVERLAWSPGGFRVIMTTKKPIHAAGDLAGVKIRVPEIPVYVSAFAALKANATPLPWGDVYSALQTGVVDGVEGPSAAIQTAAFQEVSKYMSRTNHIMNDLNLLMNLDKFNSLTAEQQQILRDSAKEAVVNELRPVMKTNEDVAYDAMAKIVEADNTPDVESFRAAMAPVYDEFIATAGPKAAEWIAAAQGK